MTDPRSARSCDLLINLSSFLEGNQHRWENHIRAAAVLAVAGAGGLGQMLAFHMGLFLMHKTAIVLIAMVVLVALVGVASFAWRRRLTR